MATVAAIAPVVTPPSIGNADDRHPASSQQVRQGAPTPAKRRGRKQTASESHGARKRLSPLSAQKLKNRQQAMSETDEYFVDDDYDSLELEEPFSSSEDEDEEPGRVRRSSKPKFVLPLPRRRIRTLSGTIPPVGYAPHWGGPTMCLGCMEFFDLPSDVDKYSAHLLKEHQIVISDISLIVDLKRYIEYWRHRFTQTTVGDVFPKIIHAPGVVMLGLTGSHYLMSEKVKEDSKIRERLAMRRLEEVLSCQQREREDYSFARQCLFCQFRVKGNRCKLVHHLYKIHHLNLGSPDNLVFVNEYLDTLKYMLDSNQCLHCEKFMPDHDTLMEHMRKKQHREVNPKNNYYDKFYVINYLELGKKWLDVLAEDFEDTMPTFADSEDEEEEEAWEEFLEDNDEEMEIVVMCLFCEHTTKEPNAAVFEHMKDEHDFDLSQISLERNYTFYHKVKLVNYIRRLTYNRHCFVCGRTDLGTPDALRQHLNADRHLMVPPEEKWMSDENLIPYFSNDFILFFLEDPEVLPEPPQWLPTCKSIAEESHPLDPGSIVSGKSSAATSCDVTSLDTATTANGNVVHQENGELRATSEVVNASPSCCATNTDLVSRATPPTDAEKQVNGDQRKTMRRPIGSSVDEDEEVFREEAVPNSRTIPTIPPCLKGDGKTRKTSGSGRTRKSSSWRDPPPVIPEDLPVIGNILDDPKLREDLM